MKKYSTIGTRPRRFDAREKIVGNAKFGADSTFQRSLWGKILRSPHAHARIISINTDDAAALLGVRAVITSADFPTITPGSAFDSQNHRFSRDNVLAGRKALYMGHAIAAVAADTREIADRAVDLIRVEYEILPAVVDVLEATEDDAPLLHQDLLTDSLGTEASRPSNIASHLQHELGDPEEGFSQADVVVEREFRSATVHHTYIEPHAATVEWRRDDQILVWTTTQGVFTIRGQLAELLQHPQGQILVTPSEIGGGFGGKIASYIEAPAALLSKKASLPVRIVMSRSDEFLATGPTSGTRIKIKMGARNDGKITAACAELFYEAGAYPGSPVGSGAALIFACYDIPNGRIDGYDIVVNKPRTTAYRAPGATPPAFVSEQVIDELAEKTGIDPLQFRMLNVATNGTRRIDSSVHTSINCKKVLEAVAGHDHYRSKVEGEHVGRGLAMAFWGNWGAQSSCALQVNYDGTVTLTLGSVDVSGTRTSLAMQAAEALELDLSLISPRMGSTGETGYNDVSAGSRTTVAGGHAVAKAARHVIAQLKDRAAMLWDVPVGSVAYAKGRFTEGKDNTMSFDELAAKSAATGGAITGIGNVNVEDWGASSGAHVADVKVDPETGKVTILRYTIFQDVGTAVHPVLVEGQLQGGTVQGIGWALYEGYTYDEDGHLLNHNLLDYKLPTFTDVPSLETVIIEEPHEQHPFGIRGVGETPIISPPGALANAIHGAVGARPSSLPMTPGSILEAMGVL